jgi:hypothetical protein
VPRNRYEHVVGESLAAHIRKVQEGPLEEQLEVFDEIAVTRGLCSQQLGLLTLMTNREGVPQELQLQALAGAKDALQLVTELCERASRITRNLSEGVSIKYLGLMMAQIMECMRRAIEELPDDQRERISLRFAVLMDEHVRLPDGDPQVPLPISARKRNGQPHAELIMEQPSECASEANATSEHAT